MCWHHCQASGASLQIRKPKENLRQQTPIFHLSDSLSCHSLQNSLSEICDQTHSMSTIPNKT